jgi:hypothetical protein
VRWATTYESLAAAIVENLEFITSEVLATVFARVSSLAGTDLDIEGAKIVVALSAVES